MKTAYLLAILTVALLLPPAETCSGQMLEEDGYYGMSVAHSEIRGKVFFASERRDVEQVPAPNIKVELRTEDESKVLHSTSTSREGEYTLPKVDLGRYRLHIGALTVNLSVEERDPEKVDELSKVVIVVIPKAMARRR